MQWHSVNDLCVTCPFPVYRYYSLFTLFMLIAFECTVVNQRVRQLSELRGLKTPMQHVQVYR